MSEALNQASPQESRTGAFWIWIAVVFALALGVRLTHLRQIEAMPLFGDAVGDAESYDRAARRIADGEVPSSKESAGPSLYPCFLGLLYATVGHDAMATRVVQCVIGAGACVLLAMAGREWFDSRTGVIAAAVLAVYPSAVFFDSILDPTGLGSALTCGVLYLVGAAGNAPSRGKWIGIGLVMGGSILTEHGAAINALVILIWSWRRGPSRLGSVSWMVAGMAAVLIPVSLASLVTGGAGWVTDTELGWRLYIGNNTDADGTFAPLVTGRESERQVRADARTLAERALGRRLSSRQVSRYWAARACAYVAGRPAAWAELLRTKFILFWNATEMTRDQDPYVQGDWSDFLRVLNPYLSYGPLCAFAAVGFGLTIAHWRRLWALYAIVIVKMACAMVFYVTASDRFPVVPILMMFAAAGLVEAWEWIRGRRTIEAWLGLMMVFLGAFVLHATRPVDNRVVRAASYRSIGRALERRGELDGAFGYYARSRDLWGGDPWTSMLLGRVRVGQGRTVEAVDFFKEAVRLAPNEAGSRVALGAGLLEAGRFDEAAEQFELALTMDPSNPGASAGLDRVKRRSGEPTLLPGLEGP